VTLSQQLYPIPFIHSAVPLNNDFLIWNLGQSDSTLLLPIVVAASMFVQQKMVQPAPPSGPLTQQQMQQQQTQQMMLWMLPLMFGFWSLNVPAGLALYWGVSNVAGIVLQYFYMGRRFDPRTLLQMGGSRAPAPAVRAPRDASPKPSAAPADDAYEADYTADDDASSAPETEPGATAAGQNTRRKRNGRRRGKR
jgi:YidC/Oxa1 family membrane protein insertase